jgi:ElaB/YqjD/DUF883 family membrane-anchored ribosome-binding protein
MKRLILSFLIFLVLVYPALCLSSYFIHFKGGGKIVTPLYWERQGTVYFYYGGGIAGVERGEVDKIERYDEMRDESGVNSSSEEKEGKPLFVSPGTEKAQQPEVVQATSEKDEGISIEDYKNEKNRLTDELDQLTENLREATKRKDKDAKDKIRQEIRNISGQIYNITDKVKGKNKGRLPEEWWRK